MYWHPQGKSRSIKSTHAADMGDRTAQTCRSDSSPSSQPQTSKAKDQGSVVFGSLGLGWPQGAQYKGWRNLSQFIFWAPGWLITLMSSGELKGPTQTVTIYIFFT